MGNMRIGPDNRAQFIQSKYRQNILELAKPIWRFLGKCDQPMKSDAIFVFGSDRLAVADKAIDLYRKGFADKILFTGGNAGRFRLPGGISEAENFKNYALQKGVPGKDILVETRSSNTQENVLFGIDSLRQHRVGTSQLILVSLPYQQLRQWATFEKLKQDPNSGLAATRTFNCPSNYTLYQIKDEETFKAESDRLLGEIDRIIEYRKQFNPFITWIDIPDDVMKAYDNLKILIKGDIQNNNPWPVNHGISLVAHLPAKLIETIPFNGIVGAYGKEFSQKAVITPCLHVTLASFRILKGEQDLSKEFQGLAAAMTSIWPPKTTSFELLYDKAILKNDPGKGTRVQLVAESDKLRSLRKEICHLEERDFGDAMKHISTLMLVTTFGDVGSEYENISARVNIALKDTLPLAVKIEKLSLVYHSDSVHSQIFQQKDYNLQK